MSKVKFNADEMMVMAMFEQPTRTETMRYIEEVVPFVEDDVEVFSLVASTMKKILPLFGRSRRISGSSQKTLMRPS